MEDEVIVTPEEVTPEEEVAEIDETVAEEEAEVIE